MPLVAVLQMVSTSITQDNLNTIECYCREARDQGAVLLALPENFASMGLSDEAKIRLAEPYRDGPIQTAVSQLAKSYGLWIIAGSIPLKSKGLRTTASCLVYDADGACVTRYDKIHLFDVRVSPQEAHQESLTIEPGIDIVVADTPIGRVGLSVCYDVRFPELYRQLVLKGAEVLVIPAAFTAVTGKAHWDILVRARAIETLCYVLAPNQGGVHPNGRKTYGHSLIVDPWGEVLATTKEGPDLLVAELVLQRVEDLRRGFPCNEHHVLDLS